MRTGPIPLEIAGISFISENRKNKYNLRTDQRHFSFSSRDLKAHAAAIAARDLMGGFETIHPSASQMWPRITYLRWRKITYEEN